MLEAELEEQRQAMEELEDELQIVSDAKLRLEVCTVFLYERVYYKCRRLIFKLLRQIMKENFKLEKIKLKKEDGRCISRYSR